VLEESVKQWLDILRFCSQYPDKCDSVDCNSTSLQKPVCSCSVAKTSSSYFHLYKKLNKLIVL